MRKEVEFCDVCLEALAHYQCSVCLRHMCRGHTKDVCISIAAYASLVETSWYVCACCYEGLENYMDRNSSAISASFQDWWIEEVVPSVKEMLIK
jgi:hypothetical protein